MQVLLRCLLFGTRFHLRGAKVGRLALSLYIHHIIIHTVPSCLVDSRFILHTHARRSLLPGMYLQSIVVPNREPRHSLKRVTAVTSISSSFVTWYFEVHSNNTSSLRG